MRGAQEAGHTVKKIFLKDKKINYCTGCGTCVSTKRCVQKDDMDDILDEMKIADTIVLASPIYFYTICGQLKTMIDRCCARYTELIDKDFYYIFTAADPTTNAVEKAVMELQGFLDCLDNSQFQGIIAGVGAWSKGEIISKPAMQEAYEMGKNV
jgi:multimeric flavodoxin WrbA